MYCSGEGTKIDYHEAFFWFTKADNCDIVSGTHKLGMMYFYGHGTKMNYSQALNLLKKRRTKIMLPLCTSWDICT
jgi:TPR repeat protein